MPCEILDFRCIVVNELIGGAFLATILLLVLYFVVASKVKLGFDTTLTMLIPLGLLFTLSFGGFTTFLAFAVILVGWLLAWIYNIMIKNN